MENQVEYYEPLLDVFMGRGSQRGWEFRLVSREGDIAIYEKRDGSSVVYEVIRVRRSKGMVGVIGGKDVEFKAKERYPSDEGFGTDGFSYGSLGDAMVRYNSLLGVECA